MADTEAPRPPGPSPEAVVERVLDVVRALARETGGPRAERAVSPDASLEREVGLGSLERVELLARLERAFSRALDDRCLSLDTPAELARALREAAPGEALRLPAREEAIGVATDIGAGVRTLHESLWRHASLDPARVHAFLRGEASEEEEPVSYGRLRDEAAAVAGGLRERGVSRGDTVALMLPTGLDFLRSFLGILLARAVPVPIYPPVRLDRLEEYAARQSAILKDAGVRLLVTIPRARPVVSLLKPAVPTLADVVTADELAAAGAPVSGPEGDGSDPAFIQYTSGSTGQPKGVLLTHDNLLANIRAIARGLEVQPTDVGVSWLPLYHDMGLIGSWLTCLHHGLPLTLLSPTAFLARPERWLWAIHQRRATLSAAPNFAYELCARRVRDEALEGLDLSSWRVALNGAEPVSTGTIDRFARRFAPHGFRPEAMMPVYGLAECSVALAFPPVGRGPRVDRVARAPFQGEGRADAALPGDATALEFVSAGRELPEHEVRDRGRRRGGRGRARGGPPRLPRALDDERLLPAAGGDGGHHAARRMAGLRGPGLPRLRRGPRLRPKEGPHHQGRPQPRAAGDRGGRRGRRGDPARLRGGLRHREPGARHRGAGRGGRDPRHGCFGKGPAGRGRHASAWPRWWTCRRTRSSSWPRARCRRPRAARSGAPPRRSGT